MRKLTITQAKPNPIGKDKFGNTIPAQQLAGEWVDFKNTGNENYPLNSIKLQHVAYTTQYPKGIWTEVTDFSGVLDVNKTVRVHSGGKIDLSLLLPIDSIGADYHIFSGKGYTWNNDKMDQPRLVSITNNQTIEVDKTFYNAHPQEGRILKRSGDALV